MPSITRVRMLRAARGCPDPITTRDYAEGAEYDLPADLAGCFLSTGDAELAGDQAADAGPDVKPAPKPARKR